MGKLPRIWIVWLLLLAAALTFRTFIALRLPNDTPDDGRVYAQLARNLLEQHVYSHETGPPYVPSFIRLPGYPLFIAAIYSVFGHNNNRAVRVAQAGIDTATCGLVAWVAYCWTPDDERKKHFTSITTLALATFCPFTAIYVATILTEVPTSFFAVLACLTATFAMRFSRHRLWLWIATGIACGLGVLFRPDSGLFAVAIGLTLVISAVANWNSQPDRLLTRLVKFVPAAALFTVAFCVVLLPWTIRNAKVFHVFQPLSPAHGEMPGEFVPRGYLLWLRTWIDDGRYVGPVLWSLDTNRISMDSFPDRAFDSDEERNRVAVLIHKYNNPDEEEQKAEEEAAAEEDHESGDEEQSEEAQNPPDESTEQNVEITPEIDARFEQIGRERIARSRFRYYLVLPFKRGISL
ncbi:MAG TPA: phospholipid carrier-dependent glycosyltransferase, partial [Pyrinomonadaceae bacterium]